MPGTSILMPGTTLEIYNGSTLGYVHTSVKNTDPGADSREAEQVQRWYLRTTNLAESFPRSTCILQKPGDTSWQFKDRESFVKKVRGELKSGQMYAKVNCMSLTPTSAMSPYTKPFFLGSSTALAGSQGDIGTAQIRKDINDDLVGYVYTEAPYTSQCFEYWVLAPAFSTVDPANANTYVSLGLPIKFKDGETFAELMFKGALPTTGSSFWCLAVQYFDYDKMPGSDPTKYPGQDW